MIPLNSDPSFHFEILRCLALSRYSGADVAEVLEAASQIKPGDLQSFSTAFHQLALRVKSQAEGIDSAKHPVSARDAWFRAATYWRAADFYLHGNPADPRIYEFWTEQTTAFDKANALLPVPGERLLLGADGFKVPAIFYSPNNNKSIARPTLIIGNGYDGAQEEILHQCGFAALERGYNVISYEGPGQPSVVRNQKLGFITEWEKVVSPVVDYLTSRPDVDASKIGLVGFSMGGWLAVRAAAFEHRLAAVVAVDGVYDIHEAYAAHSPPQWRDQQSSTSLEASTAVEAEVMAFIASGRAPTAFRWGLEQGKWTFRTDTASQFLEKTKPMTLMGLEDRITCPVYVGDAADDEFFKGQPQKVKAALGDRATLVTFSGDGAGHHCHVGAAVRMNESMLGWFDDVITSSRSSSSSSSKN